MFLSYYSRPLLYDVASSLSWTWSQFLPYMVLCFLCQFRLPMLADLKLYSFYTSLYVGRNPHSLAELPACPPNLQTFFINVDKTLEFSGGHWPSTVLEVSFPLTGLRTSVPMRPTVSAPCTYHLRMIVNSSIFILIIKPTRCNNFSNLFLE